MKPIIFNTEEVKAILDGRKTMTRRVIKPQPDLGIDEVDRRSHIEVGRYHPTLVDKNGEQYPGDEIFGAYTEDGEWGWKSPFGQVGDKLWVRETWRPYSEKEVRIEYKADGAIIDYPERPEFSFYACGQNWHPSIHMPRWASRITLEITEVRVERLGNYWEWCLTFKKDK